MEYNDQVKELLESYHDKIESETMPLLADEFTKFYVSFTELSGKLKNKGLLKEDPYLKESEVIELAIPSKEQFSEADAHWKVAERVTHFESVLSFIAHNYNFSLNTFNFEELEKVKSFVEYYNWKEILNQSASDFNTHTFGKIVISFRTSNSDALVLQTFEKCVENIISCADRIFNLLRIILIYLKESYKQFIRLDILPIVQHKYPNSSSSKITASILNEIKDNYSYLKLYKKYIDEVVREEFSADGSSLKEDVIKKLTITKKIVKKKEKEVYDPKKDLVHVLLEIGKIRVHLAGSIDKILTNHNNLKKNEGNFIAKFFRSISEMLFNLTPKTIYQLKLKNNEGKEKKLELHFEKFYQQVKKTEFELLDFTEEDKTIFFIDNNKDVNQTIDRLLITIKKQASILIALDDYLKYELKLKNIKAKGIKPELTVIKTILNSCTALYRDYLDQSGKS